MDSHPRRVRRGVYETAGSEVEQVYRVKGDDERLVRVGHNLKPGAVGDRRGGGVGSAVQGEDRCQGSVPAMAVVST